LVDVALSKRRPAPHELQAAIAACYASADDFTSTDWPQVAALTRSQLWDATGN
jgi:predicted RNA polymerase sigma factor